MAEVINLEEIKTASRQDSDTLTTDLTGILDSVGAANVKIIAVTPPSYTYFVPQITNIALIGGVQ